MSKITLQEQIEACEFGRRYWRSIGTEEGVLRASHYEAAAATLRELQAGKRTMTEYRECYNCGAEVEFKP